jgi:hypothetical protein
MPYAKLFRSFALAACTLTALAGCAASASGGAEAGASAGATPAAPRGNRNVITQEEMAASGATNLLEAVQRLRPAWLRGVNLTSQNPDGSDFVVFEGTTLLGGVDELRQRSPGYILRLRYLDAAQAMNTLPGLGQRRISGAIVIELPGR